MRDLVPTLCFESCGYAYLSDSEETLQFPMSLGEHVVVAMLIFFLHYFLVPFTLLFMSLN